MKISQSDIRLAQQVAQDFGISVGVESAKNCIIDVLNNRQRTDTDYDDFYYDLKEYFAN